MSKLAKKLPISMQRNLKSIHFFSNNQGKRFAHIINPYYCTYNGKHAKSLLRRLIMAFIEVD